MIRERELYLYQRVLSDIAGNDIQAPGSEPQRLVLHVRNWLYSQSDERVANGTMIWHRFNVFYEHFSLTIRALGYQDADLAEMPVGVHGVYPRMAAMADLKANACEVARRFGGSTPPLYDYVNGDGSLKP